MGAILTLEVCREASFSGTLTSAYVPKISTSVAKFFASPPADPALQVKCLSCVQSTWYHPLYTPLQSSLNTVCLLELTLHSLIQINRAWSLAFLNCSLQEPIDRLGVYKGKLCLPRAPFRILCLKPAA